MSLTTGLEAQSSQSLDCVPPCRQLAFSEIQIATQNFDLSLVIGHGGFGKVYKGTLTNGQSVLDVAIKRLESTSNQGVVEFWAEVEMLSKLRHCNLVSLIGYCKDGNEMILVYEYMPKGTLSYRLHECRSPLTWVRRLKISIGAARGLEYLHTGTGISQGVVHRDVKSSNVLLDGSWASKISDFGLSKIVPTNQPSTYVNTLVKGTFGYLDPNYFQTSRLTRKSDVYAFGVILFEILCGRKALDTSLDEEEMGLATWAQNSIKEGRLKQIVDLNLRETISSKCIKEFAVLANACLDSNPKKRPTMSKVVVGLESILALHEKTNKTSSPMDKKIFGITVPTFRLPSSQENSVVGRSIKSMESYLYTVGGENQILHRFDFKIINDGTENFSWSNRIEYAGYKMFKGKLQNGQGITVVGPFSHEDYDLCMNTVYILVKVDHHSLVDLLGWCIEGTNVYLVYDNLHNVRTLDQMLFGFSHAPLDWNERYKILLSVARVLLYLHKHAPIRVVCCDLQIDNVFVDERLDTKLYTFNFAVSKAIDETDYIQTNEIRGTRLAPEYAIYGRLSTKVDVFHFGMMVLETITGCNIWPSVNHITTDYVDGIYANITDTKISADSRSIKRFIHIGLWCIQDKPSNRPTMEEVVTMFLGNSCIPHIIFEPPRYSREHNVDSNSSMEMNLSDIDDDIINERVTTMDDVADSNSSLEMNLNDSDDDIINERVTTVDDVADSNSSMEMNLNDSDDIINERINNVDDA